MERECHDRKRNVLARLRRIEGQVRGLQGMVEEDRKPIDVLTQITAASNALKKSAVPLLDEFIRERVAASSYTDEKAMFAEMRAAIDQLV